MYTSVLSATIHGLEAVPVQVEVDVSSGLPGFSMVGSLSSQVREAQDRVRTALHNARISMPPSKITVNLSPGDIPKNGTGFDLPIAGAILEILERFPAGNLKGIMVAGEIGLDGKIRGIRGILSMVAKAKELGCEACIVPRENLREAVMIEDMRIVGVESLEEFLKTVREKTWNQRADVEVLEEGWKAKTEKAPYPGMDRRKNEKIDEQKDKDKEEPDFADVRGQESAKRAALLAGAGFHNLLLIGPPGSGKTLIAGRIPGLLPKLTRQEALELTSIYSIAGLLPEERPWIDKRPFRAPHHTVSAQALAGGGRIPQPGEITLAHRGVLFLDELPEMRRISLELLRQPLEERKILISRTAGRYCFPAEFLLVAAMNPCPCGYFPNRNRCNCSEGEVKRYLNKISQPLLDRIDLCAETTPPTYGEFRSRKKEKQWTTGQMRKLALKAQKIQEERYRDEDFRFNGEIPQEKISRYCITEPEAENLLQHAFTKLGLTGRGCSRILKVARTAADLEGSEKIREEHMAEAIGYRSLDKKYWE